MKRLIIFLLFMLFIGNIKAEAQFDQLKDIINNKDLSEEQKLMEVKNIPYEKKLALLKELGNTASSSEEADILTEFLYAFGLESYNDIESVDDYIAFIRFLYAKSPEKIEFYKKRLNRENYNIFFESLMAESVPMKATGDISFEAYDKFNKKLSNNTFDFNNKSDRKFFIKLMDYLDIADYSKDYDEDSENVENTIENNPKLMQTLSYYFNRNEFKNYKIKNKYHIFRLGKLIVENFNDNSEDFILKKIQDKTVNLENLCYFLNSVEFNSKISSEAEKEFDNGFYNPVDKPFEIFKEKYFVNISDINGDNNKIIQTIKSYKIPINTNDRLKISYMSHRFAPINTDYQALVLDKIKNIANNSKIKEKDAEIMIMIEDYYSKANEEYKARNKKTNEKLEKLEENIEF